MVRIKFSLDIHPRKTTSYFLKNDRSFLVKRRVTFQKTTGCFSKNDGSLFRKQRVVFHKRFDAAKRPKAHRKTHIGNRLSYTKNRICKKSYNILRARMYAHIIGVFCFLLSQVSHYSL